MHQPSGGARGQAVDIQIVAEEILAMRARLNRIYQKHTGQPLEEIESVVDRDKYMTAEDAKKFGIVDQVLESRKETGDAATGQGKSS